MKEKSTSILIVDDLKIHRDYLNNILSSKDFGFINIYEADNVDTAINILVENKIDLIFLDVEMPEKNGFELIKLLSSKGINAEVIFVTAYDRYAIQAIRNNALDFIIKPIDLKELENALNRYFEKKITNQNNIVSHEKYKGLLNSLTDSFQSNRIGLPSLHGFIFIDEKDIVQCEADNTYTTFHLIHNRKIIISKTLKECEEILNKLQFFRIHHSHLVNLNLIKEYVRGEGGHVTLINDQIIPVSRNKKQLFLSLIKKV
jgi:two-component system LytT family response regulator